MKKILHTIILLAICCSMIIISGCDSDSDFEFKPISEIREIFPQTVEELKTREFDNLDFSNADFSFPEIDKIYELSLDYLSGKSAQEIYDFFSASLETLMPGKFSEEMKKNTVKFYDGQNPDGTYQTIKEYTLTDNPYPSFETEDCFLDMRLGVLRWFDNADLMRYRGEEGKPIMRTMISDSDQLKYYITDMNSTDKFELIDGEISVKDAAEFVNNYLATMNFSPYELSAKKKTVSVSVVDIGNGKFGYNFIITPEYKNVLFDYAEIGGGGVIVHIKNDYDNRNYDIMPGQIGMIEANKIYHFILPAYEMSIAETANYTSIITLENAAEIVNEFYSDSMNFKVKSVKAVYLNNYGNAVPCWKFIMDCGGLSYNTLVNMRTGEVHVYVHK